MLVPPKRNPYTGRAGEKANILKRCYNVTLRDIEGVPAKQPKLSTDVKVKKEESNEAYGHDREIFTGEKVEEHLSRTKPKTDEKTLSDELSDQSAGANSNTGSDSDVQFVGILKGSASKKINFVLAEGDVKVIENGE